MLKNDITYMDGFSEHNGDKHKRCVSVYDSNNAIVRLFKLHGSIDWFWIKSQGDIYYRVCRIDREISPDRRYEIIEHESAGRRPALLIGTYNKTMKYSSGVFADMVCQFWNYMRHSDLLIVCGYGFSDRGINDHIINWMSSNPDSRILMVHKCPRSIKKKITPAIQRLMNQFDGTERLQFIRNYAQYVGWRDISPLLGQS